MLKLAFKGLKKAYLALRYFGSKFWDNLLGIVTTDELAASRLGMDYKEYCSIHRSIPFTALWRLMHRLNPSPNDALLDIGCGVGRVICTAAQYKFSRVIGIDIDRKCCALAKQNSKTLKRSACQIDVECYDASAYIVPDDITIIFFYNSFGGDELILLLRHILESYGRMPRRIQLIYANPREHNLVMSMERFRETGKFLISWRPGAEWGRTQMIRFYEVQPEKLSVPTSVAIKERAS